MGNVGQPIDWVQRGSQPEGMVRPDRIFRQRDNSALHAARPPHIGPLADLASLSWCDNSPTNQHIDDLVYLGAVEVASLILVAATTISSDSDRANLLSHPCSAWPKRSAHLKATGDFRLDKHR